MVVGVFSNFFYHQTSGVQEGMEFQTLLAFKSHFMLVVPRASDSKR